MDVSTVASTSIRSNVDVHRLERTEAVREDRHEHRHVDRYRRGRALGVFRQEMQAAVRTRFRAKIAVSQAGYARPPATADDVAAETLGTAKQVAAESPLNAARALISFRAKVHETASYVRETVGAREDAAEVDDAVAKIDDGLDALDRQAAANRESATSILNVDSRSKQRSTIRIRTQEGDVVKLSISRRGRIEASDTAVSNAAGSRSATEIEVSSRSRMTLKVDGDLNDAEMTAIRDVLAQAEDIAGQFFNGDIGAAFALASNIEFDAGQLSRVRMGFRSFQSSEISYRETVTAGPVAAPAIVRGEAVPVDSTPAASGAQPPAASVAEAIEQSEPLPPTADETPADSAVPVETGAPSTESSTLDSSALADFFGLLSDFLRSVGNGIGDASAGTSIRFHYSESFKLTLLKSVMQTMAPEESGQAADNAAAVIDATDAEPVTA